MTSVNKHENVKKIEGDTVTAQNYNENNDICNSNFTAPDTGFTSNTLSTHHSYGLIENVLIAHILRH